MSQENKKYSIVAPPMISDEELEGKTGEKITFTCPQPDCGKLVTKYKSHLRKSRRQFQTMHHYCSHACAQKGWFSSFEKSMKYVLCCAKGNNWGRVLRGRHIPPENGSLLWCSVERTNHATGRQHTYHKCAECIKSIEHLCILWIEQEGKCTITGVDMIMPADSYCRHRRRLAGVPGAALSPATGSLDRIDSNKSYVRGNIQFVCFSENLKKNSFTELEMKEYQDKYIDAKITNNKEHLIQKIIDMGYSEDMIKKLSQNGGFNEHSRS